MEKYSSILQKHSFVRTVRGGTEDDLVVPGLYFVLTCKNEENVAITIAHDEYGDPWIARGHVTLSRDGFVMHDLDTLGDLKLQKARLFN